MDEPPIRGLSGRRKLLALMLLLVGVATAWRFITFYVGGVAAGRTAADALLRGPLAVNFWLFEVFLGMLVPLALLLGVRFQNIPAMSLAGLLALVGQFISRFDLVTAGQLTPQYLGYDSLPTWFTYMPSIAELLVTAAGLGIVGVAFVLGERFFGKAFADQGSH